MSNSIAPGSSTDVNVKVTALTTNPNVPVTYKTIILKKNLVNGVNTLTQEMMSNANTKYVIKYDYVLGEDVTIPTNCILEFDGGSISGAYKLKGMYINIVSAPVKIFGLDVIFDWYWNNTVAYPEWFGAIGYGDVDDGPALQKTISTFRKVILSKTYKSNQSIQIESNREIIGVAPVQAGIIFGDAVSDGLVQGPISLSNDKLRNITIKNLLISKDAKTSDSYGIKFASTANIVLEGIAISNFTYGYSFNSIMASNILNCIATACDYGFYFGINGYSSTSTTLDSCYTLNCDTGYELKIISYSTLNSCAADGCRICYDFWRAQVHLNSCGSEGATERLFTLVDHGANEPNWRGNNVSIHNFVAIDYNSSDAPVYIATNTRGANDRNVVTIDNISVGLHTAPTQPRPLIEHGGDTQIYLNNFTDNDELEAITRGYNKGDSHLYINYIRLVNKYSLAEGPNAVVRNSIGDRIIVYESGNTYLGIWNGVNWVDNEGNILDQTV